MPNINITNPNPVTDPVTWFATKDAFNTFIDGLYVNVTAAGLPAATTAAIGAVMKANTTVFTDAPVTPTWVTIENDLGNVDVPSREAFEDLKAQLDNLVTNYQSLLTALATAGTIDNA